MGPRKRLVVLFTLLPALLAPCAAASAPEDELYLAGLGLHQETGRNIYLGGIYLERQASRPKDLIESPGTRVMEYRVVARRTSIRSLLGGMLLQSEVATGHPPDAATTDFADNILSAVTVSLYAGDSLKIMLTADDETIALLNGHELARVKSAAVADYVLMGWVGESGPSTVFRDNITRGRVDPSLLSALEANTYSTEREAEIAAWLRKPEPAPRAPRTAVATSADPATLEPVRARGSRRPLSPTALAPVTVAATPLPARNAGETADAEGAPETGSGRGSAAAGLQLASLAPPPGARPQASLEEEIQALGIREYSRRLLAFHGALVRMVHSQIRYPKRAVRRGLQGRLELDVTFDATGAMLDIAIASPSGHTLLDDAAIDAVREAFAENALGAVDPVAIAEFGDFSTRHLTVPVPVSFRLE